MLQKVKGITLISLIVTIIILLILSGIVVTTMLNDKGMFEKINYAKQKYLNAQLDENLQIQELEKRMNAMIEPVKQGDKIPITIQGKAYWFTCIDTNYQEKNLFLCDEVLSYSICGPNDNIIYERSSLREWLNQNAPNIAEEITLEDTNTVEKMFILSKEENEKYEKYTAVTWQGSKENGNYAYWTRNYAGQAGHMHCRLYSGETDVLDVYWTRWAGCKPAFVTEKTR